MKKITVVITGVGGGGVGEQVMKSLRLCGDRYRIVGTDMTEFSIGLYRADAKYILPPANDDGYIDKLLEICDKEEGIETEEYPDYSSHYRHYLYYHNSFCRLFKFSFI